MSVSLNQQGFAELFPEAALRISYESGSSGPHHGKLPNESSASEKA